MGGFDSWNGGLQNHPTSVIWIGNHWSWGTNFWETPENGGMTSIFHMNGIGNCRTCYNLWLPQVGRILPCQIWLPVVIHETNMSCNWTWNSTWNELGINRSQRHNDPPMRFFSMVDPEKHPKTIGIFRYENMAMSGFQDPPMTGWPKFLPGYPHFRWERQADPAAEIHILYKYIYIHVYIHDLQVIIYLY